MTTQAPSRANGAKTKAAASRAVRGAADDAASTPSAPAAQHKLAALVSQVLKDNCALNLRLRIGLAAFGLATGVLALVYTARHGDDIAAAVNGSGDALSLLAATIPVALFVALGALAGVAAWAVHSRGVDEMYNTLDTVSRIEREGEVAVSARGLIYAFDENLKSARQAFALLLWLGRTLFIVCLGLVTAAVINAMSGGDTVVTAALGGSSILGALLGVVKSVPRNIAHNVADVVQIQMIITGCYRQISLLESAAFNAMHCCADRTEAQRTVLQVQRRMDRVVADAVARIERYTDVKPGD